jgi:ornithine carbamoyltransferase
MTTRHLLEIDDFSHEELDQVLERCTEAHPVRVLQDRGAALIFEKPSNRTRNSTEMAVVELGGHPIYLKPDEVDIDGRESAEDVARTLACYHSVIAARVFDHTVLERMATAVEIPVVNLLSDLSHPLQALADLLTIRAEFGPDLGGRTVTWVGDYSNVARSLGYACAMQGMKVRFSCPEAYQPPAEDLVVMAELGADWAEYDGDPQAAVEGTDVLVTDAWYSMGQEEEQAVRKPLFERYRVDQALLDRAHDDAIFLHCLPAHRGEEVTNEVLDGPQSRVWTAARNRQPAARGALEWLVITSEAAR